MDLQEAGCGDMDWIDLAQDRNVWWALVHAVMRLQVPENEGNFLTIQPNCLLLRKDSAACTIKNKTLL
jgi:hypothetical protein